MLQRDCEQTEAWTKQFVKRVPAAAKASMFGVLTTWEKRERMLDVGGGGLVWDGMLGRGYCLLPCFHSSQESRSATGRA